MAFKATFNECFKFLLTSFSYCRACGSSFVVYLLLYIIIFECGRVWNMWYKIINGWNISSSQLLRRSFVLLCRHTRAKATYDLYLFYKNFVFVWLLILNACFYVVIKLLQNMCATVTKIVLLLNHVYNEYKKWTSLYE